MQIRPFRGWQYKTTNGDVSKLVAPPYDILSADDKQQLLAASPVNIVSVDMPHVPPKELGPDEVYRQAAARLAQWQQSGVMVQSDQPAIYAYEQTFAWAGRTFSRRALLCGVRASELGKEVIPHEHTFAGPKADRLKLMQYTSMQLSPIFGFFEGKDAADTLWSAVKGEPTLHGELRGVTEKLWAITDPQVISAVAGKLSAKPVFIADGHHRYTTALNYRDWLVEQKGAIGAEHEANFVMFALVEKADEGLLVLPTHRIIRGLSSNFDLAKLMSAAPEFSWQRLPAEADFGNADALLAPFGEHSLAFVGPGAKELWVGTLKDISAMAQAAGDQLPAWRELDVAILHKLIVDRALSAFKTPQTAIDYTPDGPAVLDACRHSDAQLGVCMQGTPLAAVETIARAGASMPHKSTYFYPKLATGMVLKPLE